MKRSAWTALIIMTLSLIALPFAWRKVNGGKEEVVITQEVLAGDPSAAEGITLEMATHWDGHLLWNTKYTIGSGEEAESSLTFSSEEARWSQVEKRKAYMDFQAGAGYGSAATYNGVVVNPDELPFPELTRAVAERTEPGKQHTETVRIGDYVQLYPVNFELEGSSVEYAGDYNENIRYLTELFHISTGQDRMELTMEKDGQGRLTAIQSHMVTDREDLEFLISGASDFGQAGCYYAYECENRMDGNAEDRGQNNGIFYQPFRQEEGWLVVDVTKMRKVCEIPEQTIPQGMLLDEENGRLYLEVRGEEDYRLCVYRLEGEIPVLTQELSIRRRDEGAFSEGAGDSRGKIWNEDLGDYSVRPVLRRMQKEGDDLLITWSDNGFAFVTEEQEQGQYGLWCGGTFPDYLEQNLEVVGERPFPGQNGCVFDGERLVLAAFEDWKSVNALVAVYGKTGEIYCGLYRNSGAPERDWSDSFLYENRILPQGQENWRYFWNGYTGEIYREGEDGPVIPLKIY